MRGFKKGEFKHSEETKRKLSEMKKGKKPSKEAIENMRKAQVGRKHSTETKEKIRLANLGKKHTEESKRKMGERSKGNKWNVGKKYTEERKRKISQSRLKNPTRYWLGKHLSDEHKKKLSVKSSQRVGEKASNWKGGKSFEPYSVDWNNTLKRSIRERDKYICQLCTLPQGDEALSVHHIDYNKLNCNPTNLITLCRSCHTKTNGKRDYWTNYFNTR
ncbi:NUMOD3 domain-containing DNA-binding protein [Candidatus Dojkabacteria bacterium]|jgi:5-methylcytosine-specific restriction endonuclease McrA|nr:NUMOD3 domain-containing DNA-binding protein [Candidatus Dojkabacteria bacterium]